jgi:hypothetical protein
MRDRQSKLKKRIAKNSSRAESRYQLLQEKELRTGPSQIVDGDKIAMATAGEYAIAAALWSVLAGLIIAVWILLFDACWLTVPVGWGANFCPRPIEREALSTEEIRSRELAALLVIVKSDLLNRAACPVPQP